MSDRARNLWASYWAEQSTPFNRSEADEYYAAYGAELSLLLPPPPHGRVLEVGCGDGALFAPLGFDRADRYLGVDLSERMLEGFRERHPGVEVRTGRAESFRVDERFDVIFSSAMAQFLDRHQLADHVANIAAMVADDGVLVLASNPWRRLRWGYARGDLTAGTRRSLPLALAAHAKRRLVRDNMGHWHDYPDIERLAAAHGLTARFYGSVNYPYRFHSVLQRAG